MVTAFPERLDDEAAHLLLILDYEDGARTPHLRGAVDHARVQLRRTIHLRQADSEGRALIRLAEDIDRALVLLNNAVHGGQAQARALGPLRGEERLEDVLQGGFVHAFARIADGKTHGRPGPRLGFGRRRPRVQPLVGSFDDQRAATGHSVARIDRQIHEHLVKMARIGHGEPKRRIEPDDSLHIFAEQAAEHLLGLLDDRIEIQRPGAADLFPAECQQLTRKFGCARPGFTDLIDLPRGAGPAPEAVGATDRHSR